MEGKKRRKGERIEEKGEEEKRGREGEEKVLLFIRYADRMRTCGRYVHCAFIVSYLDRIHDSV